MFVVVMVFFDSLYICFGFEVLHFNVAKLTLATVLMSTILLS